MKKLLASAALIALLTAGASAAHAQSANDLNKAEVERIENGQPAMPSSEPTDAGQPMGGDEHGSMHGGHCKHHHHHCHHKHHHHWHHHNQNGAGTQPAPAEPAAQ